MILERAGNCCEECGVHNYTILGNPGRIYFHHCNSFAEAVKALKHCHPSDQVDKFIIVVLTISHTDHFPMNCAPENLRALCQKCHNSHDAKHRAAKRKLARIKATESIAPSLPLYTSKFQPV
jgi:hypothetical protein